MAVNCTPAALAEASACFCFDNDRTREAVMIYLLNKISGLNLDKNTLATNSKCFCFGKEESRAAITYLLCQIANV